MRLTLITYYAIINSLAKGHKQWLVALRDLQTN